MTRREWKKEKKERAFRENTGLLIDWFINHSLDQHPENDESHAATRYAMQEEPSRQTKYEKIAVVFFSLIGAALFVGWIVLMYFAISGK